MNDLYPTRVTRSQHCYFSNTELAAMIKVNQWVSFRKWNTHFLFLFINVFIFFSTLLLWMKTRHFRTSSWTLSNTGFHFHLVTFYRPNNLFINQENNQQISWKENNLWLHPKQKTIIRKMDNSIIIIYFFRRRKRPYGWYFLQLNTYAISTVCYKTTYW